MGYSGNATSDWQSVPSELWQQAHDAVYEAAQASFIEGRSFAETLAEEPEVSAGLTREQVQALLDPTAYTGACGLFAERGAAQAREVAGVLRGD